jgi:Holliday junction resolvase
MGRSQRVKGAVGEREVVNIFKKFGFNLWRVPNSGGLKRDGNEKGDIKGLDGWHLEVKRQETLSLPAWLRQAEEDCPDGDEPLLVFRRSHEPWRVVLSLEKFIELIGGKDDGSSAGSDAGLPDEQG